MGVLSDHSVCSEPALELALKNTLKMFVTRFAGRQSLIKIFVILCFKISELVAFNCSIPIQQDASKVDALLQGESAHPHKLCTIAQFKARLTLACIFYMVCCDHTYCFPESE